MSTSRRPVTIDGREVRTGGGKFVGTCCREAVCWLRIGLTSSQWRFIINICGTLLSVLCSILFLTKLTNLAGAQIFNLCISDEFPQQN